MDSIHSLWERGLHTVGVTEVRDGVYGTLVLVEVTLDYPNSFLD